MEIIYQDHKIIVINKPPGISVHGGVSVSGNTVADQLLAQFPEIGAVGDNPDVRPGIVHRLDKDTSGVMVVARTQKSFEQLKNLFKTRQVEKTYRAIICGAPKQKTGAITFPIGRLIKNPLKRGVDVPVRPGPARMTLSGWHPGGCPNKSVSMIRGARDACTEYRVLMAGHTFSLVELKPKTGRMHQLRVHLKAIGTPIACDRVYGGKNVCCPTDTGRQLLHAHTLSFTLDNQRFLFEADPPKDFTLAEQMIA